MSELSKLANKAKKVKVGDTEITIQPLSMSDMDLFDKENASDEETVNMMRNMIKKSIPESTDEEIDKLSLESMLDLQEAIMRANSITEERIKKKVEFMKSIKEAQDAQSA